MVMPSFKFHTFLYLLSESASKKNTLRRAPVCVAVRITQKHYIEGVVYLTPLYQLCTCLGQTDLLFFLLRYWSQCS